jgi:hypothetical protein
MDKKELIGFVLNDIKELGLIVEGMHEMDKIPKIMQELVISKTQNILDKFHQLEEVRQKKEEIISGDILTENKNLLTFVPVHRILKKMNIIYNNGKSI